MPEKYQKILYWLGTGILSAIMLFSVFNYFFNHEMIKGFWETLGYPTYLIYPLAVAKLLGLFAILCKKPDWLKEWAYAGFFFNISLALVAHLVAKDGAGMFAIVALIGLLVSYYFDKKLFSAKS
ncbi:MAG: DoxX family protein [Bacteroidota bacterium]